MELEGHTDKKDKGYVMVATAATYQTPTREGVKVFILDYLRDGKKETADLDGMMKVQGTSKGTLEKAKAELKRNGQITCFNRGSKPKVHYCKRTDLIPSGTMRE